MTGLNLIAVLALVLAWGGAGFWAGDNQRNSAWLRKEAAQVQAAAQALQAAQVRGDALTTALVRSQGQVNQLKQEAHRALSTATTGRTCLDGAAVRVLQHAPGITLLPTAASGAAAALGAPASAGGDAAPAPSDYTFSATDITLTATDTQVAHWAVEAAAHYTMCRTQLHALIDWHTTP